MSKEKRIRINWFSPLPPAKTDIAHYTTRVLPALADVAEVTVWTDQQRWDAELDRTVRVRKFRADRPPTAELNGADITIYNIGNNPEFHGGIWTMSQQLSGLVVLHDLRLHHFFDGIFRVQRRDLHSYLAVMNRYYGAAGQRDAAICFQHEAKNIDEMAERYPLTELALENSLGVVVHTAEAFATLARNSPRPLSYAPLPFAARARPNTLRHSEDRFRLIVFGYIGRNRRLESILRALAQSEHKGRFQLDVFGSILNDEKKLRSLISSLGLTKGVSLHGYKTESELDEALSRADLAINLRYPTMGEASGSQLRIWDHALPSFVSNVGWYASLPSDAVAFVRTDEHEIEDLQSHLRAFLENPQRFFEMGQRGRRELEEKHAPETYVARVMELATAAQGFSARLAGFDLAERTARAAAQYLPPTLLDETFQRVAEEVHTLVEGR